MNFSGHLADPRRTWQMFCARVTKALAGRGDLALPVGVMLVGATVFISVPIPVISLLLSLNLAFSLIVVANSLTISKPTQLTTYPTTLLIATVARICLSLSVARSVLIEGQAGEVIELLGKTTAGGNVIVGCVMFVMILAFQFIVVAKGSERVAEVAARFTLDAMPGKQMSIDADLRAGLITQEQARGQRAALQRESQLYGAMDGAMKFVKNESVLTIIVAVVNLGGGFATGVLVKGLTFGQAMQKYAILTIGDGLAAIIPSVFIAISAGFVVTRVASDDDDSDVGADIGRQLFGDMRPVALTACLLLALALLLFLKSGRLATSFLAVAAFLGAAAYGLLRRQRAAAREAEERGARAGARPAQDDLQPTFAVPIAVVVSKELTALVDSQHPAGARFRASLPKLRSAVYYDVGVLLPSVYVSGDAPLKANQYFIAIKEVPVVYGTLKPDGVFVNDSAENIKVFGLEGEEVRNPADLRPGAWIPAAQREAALQVGLKIWEPLEVIALHLSHVMKRYAHEFVGIQEAQAYLDFAARGVPKLVEEVVPKTISIHQFTEVLQRLVQEGVSIRDVKSILDALSEWGRIEKDPVMLTEYVRSSLKRYISFRYTAGRETLFVYLLDPEIEDVISGAIRRTATGSFLSLDPALAHDILDALRREIATPPPSAQRPVVVTDMELRRFVRKMVELEFPQLAVLSYQELTPELNVQPVARISMRPSDSAYAAESAARPAGALTAPALGARR